MEAVTGSGKTLAFVIPILEKLMSLSSLDKHDIGAVIISPIRELASQIHEVLTEFSQEVPKLTTMLMVGGNNVNADIEKVWKFTLISAKLRPIYLILGIQRELRYETPKITLLLT